MKRGVLLSLKNGTHGNFSRKKQLVVKILAEFFLVIGILVSMDSAAIVIIWVLALSSDLDLDKVNHQVNVSFSALDLVVDFDRTSAVSAVLQDDMEISSLFRNKGNFHGAIFSVLSGIFLLQLVQLGDQLLGRIHNVKVSAQTSAAAKEDL